MPAGHLVTAGFDPLRDEGEMFAHRLREAGVRMTLRREPDLIHGFASMLGMSVRSREAVAQAAGCAAGRTDARRACVARSRLLGFRPRRFRPGEP